MLLFLNQNCQLTETITESQTDRAKYCTTSYSNVSSSKTKIDAKVLFLRVLFVWAGMTLLCSSQNNSVLMTWQDVTGTLIMGHLINSQLIIKNKLHLLGSKNTVPAEYDTYLITDLISDNHIYLVNVITFKGRFLKLIHNF